MSIENPYGELFPRGESLPHPNTYSAPDDLAIRAVISAESLAYQEPLNYGSVEMHMRALAGLYNGSPSIDDPTYARMSDAARQASRDTGSAAFAYMTEVGLGEKLISDFKALHGQNMSDSQRDGFLINAMQMHVLLVEPQEMALRMSQMRRVLGNTTQNVHLASLWQSQDMVARRRNSQIPYSDEGIRRVLRDFGKNFGTVLIGFYQAASPTVDRREIVHHATGCLEVAGPSR